MNTLQHLIKKEGRDFAIRNDRLMEEMGIALQNVEKAKI